MSWAAMLAEAASLTPPVVAAIGAVSGFLVVLAVGVQVSASRLRHELRDAEVELVDRATGLLPRSAVRVRLGAEIAWAVTSRTPIAVAVLRIRDGRFKRAAHVLRESMREEEIAFKLSDDRIAVELWGADPAAALAATRRLGEDLAAAGHPVVDAGLACSPRDGNDVETLVRAAQRDLRPIDEPQHHRDDAVVTQSTASATTRALGRLAAVAPGFAAAALLVLVAWRLLPAAIEPALSGDGSRTGEQLAYALIAAIGLPLGAALLLLASWNHHARILPQSRPLARAGWRTGCVTALVVGAPLAWGVFAPERPAQIADSFGATLAVLALVLVALLHARQLVHLPPVMLALGIALGAGIVWWSVEGATLPVVANAGRLLVAASLGALLARSIERASWLVLLALVAAAVDAWSVLSNSGLSRQLLDRADAGEGDRIVELVLFTGPSIGGDQLLALGTTDLVFVAMFFAWAHDWRLDMRAVCAAMLIGTWGGVIASELLAETIPLLPFVCGSFLVVVAARAVALRRRRSAWKRSAGRTDNQVLAVAHR